MGKDAKGHGSNKREMEKLDATPWGKLTPEQQGQLRAYRQERSAKAPALYEGAPGSVTRRKEAQNAAGLKALGETVKANPKMRSDAEAGMSKVRSTTKNQKY